MVLLVWSSTVLIPTGAVDSRPLRRSFLNFTPPGWAFAKHQTTGHSYASQTPMWQDLHSIMKVIKPEGCSHPNGGLSHSGLKVCSHLIIMG